MTSMLFRDFLQILQIRFGLACVLSVSFTPKHFHSNYMFAGDSDAS